MKEKTYKTRRLAITALEDGESTMYDRTKKKYVNIKLFTTDKDPFTYSPEKMWIICMCVAGIYWGGGVGMFTFGAWAVLIDYYFNFHRYLKVTE